MTQKIVLYKRTGCHLCEIALEKLQKLQSMSDISLTQIDIDTSDELTEKYGLYIPVIELNGEMVQYGHVDEEELIHRLKD